MLLGACGSSIGRWISNVTQRRITRPIIRAPSIFLTIRPCDRLCFGLYSLWLSQNRRTKVSIVLRPSSFVRFHQALVRCKYRLLYTAKRRAKPGPKGPSGELIAAVVEMKRRNRKFGYLKIAQQISYAFGVELNKDVVRRILQQHYAGLPHGNGPVVVNCPCSREGRFVECRPVPL